MKTPDRITREEYMLQLRQFIEACGGNDVPRCKACSTPIQWARPHVSLHAIEFVNCTGQGRVLRVPVPYCPTCEPEPASQGCLHLSYGSAAVGEA